MAPFKGRQAKAEAALVTRAYGLAASKHAGQVRRSGEAYLSHPLAVARIVAEQTQDPVAIAAALLHDVVEDTDISLDDLRRQFPPAVAEIVDGVTKVERTLFATKEAQQAATMRKLVIAMADDLRVLIIKLADRLHNMRTLAAMPVEKQQAIARETFDVYAPLALRLGMDDVRMQLEDLAFAALHPKWYAEIDQMVWNRTPEREVYLTQVAEEVRMRLEEVGITAEVTGRPKHLWSIYEKMVIKGREFSEIFDLVGIRVVVGTIKDSYAAVGSIHQMWMPVQGRFKDYIAMPKYNTYQSLHTTVVGPQGKQLEVQIRTREMDLRASFGVAAHWRYKAEPDELEWLDRMIEWQSDVSDPSEFMANLKGDLDQDEVVAFTPKGEVVHLPAGATPGRLRLRHPHPDRPQVHRRQGRRLPRRAVDAAALRADRRDLHGQDRGRRARRRTGSSGSPRPRPRRRSASGWRSSGATACSRSARRSWRRSCGSAACPWPRSWRRGRCCGPRSS